MMQVRLMMLPVSTYMSGPPSIFTSGSEIFLVERSSVMMMINYSSPLKPFHLSLTLKVSYRIKAWLGKCEMKESEGEVQMNIGVIDLKTCL